ncbi:MULTISPECIES: hypothetical protein [Aeromonas]|uniref:hypothetical protein n=1 Tax=Aeromonas TaxID=642 RepID=UPI0003910101|nr:MULTISPECIES: hypothetical protein [Aeromonas]MBL0523199.1 hypothetical protein [Aeromonas enteropelogenes]QMS78834.1 hypothetical protein M001_021895 [Aeromonas veronii Hm21]
MSIESELARALGHIYAPKRAGVLVRINLGNTTRDVSAVITNDLHVGGDGSGFTSRYDNRADGNIASRWMVSFQKPHVADLILSGCFVTVLDAEGNATGQTYELQEPVDEVGQKAGEITYGAATK